MSETNPLERRSETAIRAEALYHPDRDDDWPSKCGTARCCHTEARMPCPPDPWMPCERCGELIEETYCTHGQTLCTDDLHWCRYCMDEMADERAYDDDRDEGLA